MADHKPAIEKILKYEGGYANDPDDRGGETKFGISKRQYPDLDIAALDRETAIGIYYRDYWCNFLGDKITNQAVAEELLDISVNMGVHRACCFLQEAYNLLSSLDLNVDGFIGPRTIAAVNGLKYQAALVKTLNGLQFERYREIVEKDPTQEKFFRSWLARVEFNS